MTNPEAANIIVIAAVTLVEMFSLLARRVREDTLPVANATALGNVFLLHTEKEYLTVPVDSHVLVQARALVERHPLRTLDAIQLASAQRAGTILGEAMTFVSSDRNLLTAAHAEGLLIDDPLTGS